MSYSSGEEIKIVDSEAGNEITDVGAQAAKAMVPSYRYRYSRKFKYILENGTVIESGIRGLTKPKLQDRIDRTRKNIELGELFAKQCVNDGEKYWTFITKFYIGPR